MKLSDFFIKDLFHATFEPYVHDILKYGLGSKQHKNWEDSKEGVVYLADDPHVAESFAETSETVPDDFLDQIVVFKIDSSKLDRNLLFADSNNQDSGTYEYHGVIHGQWLTRL